MALSKDRSAVNSHAKLSRGGAAENLDWLSGDSQASTMLHGFGLHLLTLFNFISFKAESMKVRIELVTVHRPNDPAR